MPSLALNPVSICIWPLPAGLWVSPPVCGVEGHSPGGRGGRSIAEAWGGTSSHLSQPPAQGPCRCHLRLLSQAAGNRAGSRGVKGRSREGDRGALGGGGSPARPGAPGHRTRPRALPALNHPRVFNVFPQFPREEWVAWV